MTRHLLFAQVCALLTALAALAAQAAEPATATPAEPAELAVSTAPAAALTVLPTELQVFGDFDNAQLHGIRVEDAAGPWPRIILAGALDVPGLPEKARDVNCFLYWHFGLKGCRGRTVRFEIYLNKAGPWTSAAIVPTICYGQPGGGPDGRIELARGVEVKSFGPALNSKGEPIRNMEKLRVSFSHQFRDEQAYVSYSLPFNNDAIAALVDELRPNKFVAVNELGRTPLFAKPLYQLVVTDPATPDKEKKGVWLYAGEDPWEFPGVYALAGFVKFVAGDDPLAAEFRRKFVLSAIPHVNPDALRRGDTNFYLDPKGRNIINTGLSWARTDLPANELIKAAMRKWKDDGRSLDFMTSMHSSCFWSAVMRIDWAYDQAAARKFIDEVYGRKYVPWAAGNKMGTPADMSGTLGSQVAAKLWPDRLIFFGQHLEQIILGKNALLGMKQPAYPAGLGQDVLRCQRDDLYNQGELFARAVADYYGVKVELAQAPPILMCGEVDAYASPAGAERTYTVLYRDLEGREAKFVKLHVGPRLVEMKREAGKNPVNGILYSAQVAVTEGSNEFFFEASNGRTEIRYPRSGALLGAYVVKTK